MENSSTANSKNLLLEGLQKYNRQDFYEAHEFFEDAWRKTPGPSREFYRGLLQISGGFFRLTQGRKSAAKKFFQRALQWLEDFPVDHMGFDLAKIQETIQIILESIDTPLDSNDIIERYFQPIEPPSN